MPTRDLSSGSVDPLEMCAEYPGKKDMLRWYSSSTAEKRSAAVPVPSWSAFIHTVQSFEAPS